jgi:SRSO17 transposase
MDGTWIRQMKPALTRYLNRFSDCFSRKDTRAHMPTYVEGQLSNLDRKSVEPIALAAGVPVRTLQEFLAQYAWDEDAVRDRLQQMVVKERGSKQAIGVFDETSDVKKGIKTPGVQRQWCGKVGKTDNCIVTVHLAFAQEDFHCLLDGELFLPESWSEDRPRCRNAGIPDEMVYRPKWKIALELYDRAIANGLEFEWLTFDEGYGAKGPFLLELDKKDQLFIGEVPTTMTGWLKKPKVELPPKDPRPGRPQKGAKIAKDNPKAQPFKKLLHESPKFTNQQWERYRVKDGDKGPMVWEVKHSMIYRPDGKTVSSKRWHLLIARNPLKPEEVKYFLSNAPATTSVQKLLLVAFSRWHVERCFQDQKQDIGLDAWEGRKYLGLKRHLILSSVSYLFLTMMRERLGGKKIRVHRLSNSRRRVGIGAELVA